MKKILTFIFIVLVNLPLFGQEIEMVKSIVSSAGGNIAIESTKQNVQISKWRLGQVHFVTLGAEKPEVDLINSKITVYPNPVKKDLHIGFRIETAEEYSFEISDMAGKRMLLKESTRVLPEQVITMDVSGLVNGIYLLSIIPSGDGVLQVAKFSKQ